MLWACVPWPVTSSQNRNPGRRFSLRLRPQRRGVTLLLYFSGNGVTFMHSSCWQGWVILGADWRCGDKVLLCPSQRGRELRTMWNEPWKGSLWRAPVPGRAAAIRKADLQRTPHFGGLPLPVLATTQPNCKPQWPCSALLSAARQTLAPASEALHG